MMTLCWMLLAYVLVGCLLLAAACLNDILRGDALEPRRVWRAACLIVFGWPYALWVMCFEMERVGKGGR